MRGHWEVEEPPGRIFLWKGVMFLSTGCGWGGEGTSNSLEANEKSLEKPTFGELELVAWLLSHRLAWQLGKRRGSCLWTAGTLSVAGWEWLRVSCGPGTRGDSWIQSLWEEPPSKLATWWETGAWGVIQATAWTSLWEAGTGKDISWDRGSWKPHGSASEIGWLQFFIMPQGHLQRLQPHLSIKHLVPTPPNANLRVLYPHRHPKQCPSGGKEVAQTLKKNLKVKLTSTAHFTASSRDLTQARGKV